MHLAHRRKLATVGAGHENEFFFITRLGKWSAGLILAFALFIIVFQIFVAYGERGGDSIFSNLKLTIPMLLAGGCGVTAFLQEL